MLAFRKTEIASDLLNVAMGVPFEALQANGEPCVSSRSTSFPFCGTSALLPSEFC